jgi:hypothetical protein
MRSTVDTAMSVPFLARLAGEQVEAGLQPLAI